MSETTELSPFNERDFQAIESAVLETEKGRWFLNEFAHRNRVADTQTLLSALGRLERNLTAQPITPLDEQPDIAALSNAIDATCADISSVRNDMLKDCAQIPADKAVFSHLSESAHQIAVDLIATAEALQSTVSTLRNGTGDGSHVETIDGHVHTLFDGGWRQDVLAQRVSKAMGLLEHLDQNLKNLSNGLENYARTASPNEISKAIPTALTAENLKFFDGDDEMFTADSPEPQKLELDILKDDPAKAPHEDISAAEDTNDAAATDVSEPDGNAETAPVATSHEPPKDSLQSHNALAQAAIEPEPSPATPVEPLAEPNIVIIRRGKNTSDTVAANDAPDAQSITEDIPITPSHNEEKPAEEIVAPEPKATPNQFEFKTEETVVAPAIEIPWRNEAPATTPHQQAGAAPVISQEVAEPADTTVHAEQPNQTTSDTEFGDTTKKVTESRESSAAVAPQTPLTTDQDTSTPDTDPPEEKQRIVVIRRSSSQEAEIPFADYLGIETDPVPKSKSAG